MLIYLNNGLKKRMNGLTTKEIKSVLIEKIPYYINEWRILPRVMVGLYGYVFWHVSTWFMALADPTASQAAFVSTIVGASAAFFGLYVNSGYKKSKE